MNGKVDLTPRENQVAERIAWGATFKEVAYALHITYKTVDNTMQKIFRKTGCRKTNELSAWWFCTHFNISFDLSPMARSVISSFLLLIFIGGEIHYSKDFCRYRSGRRIRTENIRDRIKD